MVIRWVEVFVDRPRADVDGAARFWSDVTRTQPSSWREDHRFVTLLPAVGDSYVRIQAVDDLPRRSGVHLDLVVDDLPAQTTRLAALGATVTSEDETLTVLRSPAGLPFCLTPYDRTPYDALRTPRRPPPVGEPATRLDQVAVDVPADRYDIEASFWADVTEWERLTGAVGPFEVLRPHDWGNGPADDQPGPPVRLLLQRLDEPDGPAGMHLDLACADRARTTEHHLTLGAEVVGHGPRWTVLRDPVGGVYCLTDRDPTSGTLPSA